LPAYPTDDIIPSQLPPFTVPDNFQALLDALMQPLEANPLCKNPPPRPEGVESAHPFVGGESFARDRLAHLIGSGIINTYKDTRNGLLGTEFSTKLSAYLVYGSITARQIHWELLSFEDGTDSGKWAHVQGYGQGENAGTKSIRFELLWRDYMRLCSKKFGHRLFRLGGFRSDSEDRWNSPDRSTENASKEQVQEMVERFLNGTTGLGLIDASQRELFHTGYTSNRARQNSASFFAKLLYIDWRIGAEWYESMLVDYDVSSNWGNWQYLAGVGNDPRGEARVFNPVKQAFDYDPNAEYCKAWIPELKELTDPGEVFQPWTIRDHQKKRDLGLMGLPMVENPLKKIDFTVGRRSRQFGRNRGGGGGGGSGRGGFVSGPGTGSSGGYRYANFAGGRGGFTRGDLARGSGDRGMGRRGYQGRGGYGGGRSYGGSSRGHIRGFSRGRGESGGRDLRSGPVDKDRAAGDGQDDGLAK
jgi:deoxyribodipyrimidine photo-lyase